MDEEQLRFRDVREEPLEKRPDDTRGVRGRHRARRSEEDKSDPADERSITPQTVAPRRRGESAARSLLCLTSRNHQRINSW